MARSVRGLVVSAADRVRLVGWIRKRSTPQGVVRRGRIVLSLGDGISVRAVAVLECCSRRTVELWRDRFEQEGPNGLLRERSSRARTVHAPSPYLEGSAKRDFCLQVGRQEGASASEPSSYKWANEPV